MLESPALPAEAIDFDPDELIYAFRVPRFFVKIDQVETRELCRKKVSFSRSADEQDLNWF